MWAGTASLSHSVPCPRASCSRFRASPRAWPIATRWHRGWMPATPAPANSAGARRKPLPLPLPPRATDCGNLLTADRQFWHCGAYTASQNIVTMVTIPTIPYITKICCFLWHVVECHTLPSSPCLSMPHPSFERHTLPFSITRPLSEIIQNL